MGKSGSGKTSMRSIIFSNFIARDTRRLGPTMDVEHVHLRFLGGLVLNLWDCGGQAGFMESYFATQRENIFRNVEVLIYVFDVESQDLKKDMVYYGNCLDAINEHSPGAKVFCLVHKMDLVPQHKQAAVLAEREKQLIAATRPGTCVCFGTSIWDETLYKAWSKIVYQMVPNVKALEKNLIQLCDVLEADEIILFERSTFLEIACHTTKEHPDPHRFDKISTIIKQFKLSCTKSGANFTAIELQTAHFSAFIDGFTPNTYVMVIMSDPSIGSSATLLNIRNAKKHFEKLEKVEAPHSAILG
nr:Ras GTP binding protein A [Hymenolepis microstoma]